MYLVLALLLQVAPQAPPPDLKDILQRMFTRLEHDANRQKNGVRCIKERVDEDITDPSEPRTNRLERYRVWGDGTQMHQQSVWRNGKVVNDAVEPLPFFMEPELLHRFNFSLAEPAHVVCDTGRTCWRLSFVPREGAIRRSDSIEQKLLNDATGTILVDDQHYGILRADALTTKPYRSWKVDVFWFVVAMTQQEIEGTMVTATIEFSFAYDPIIGRAHTKRRFYEYTEFSLPPF